MHSTWKARLSLQALGVEFDRTSVDIEEPERWFAVHLSQIGNGWRVGTAADAVLAGAAEILVAEIDDGLVGALVLVVLLFYLLGDEVDLLEIQRRLHDLLVVFEDARLPNRRGAPSSNRRQD